MRELEGLLKEAGEILKEGFYGEFETQHKGKADLVTEYDVKVENFLLPRLKEIYPEYEIVGEESFKGDEFRDSGVFVDPIDGTTNFVHGLPFVGISVGVWKNGEAVEGGVYNPVLDKLYLAQKGGGAYCNGKKIEVSKTASLQDALLDTGFPYTKNSSPIDLGFVLNSLTNLLPKARDIRRYGSASLDLCMVAEGKFDGFYEINLKPWDVAAGVAILLEAGGKVSAYDGEAFGMNDRTIVATNSHLHQVLVDEVTF
jgi:myo-inositol-1(or 4)-monophosphatase